MPDYDVRKIVHLGLLVSIAMALNLFESIIPLPAPIPGAKLGLANIVTLFVIARFGIKEAVILVALRTFLVSLFSGSLLTPTFFLSFSGGIASSLIMGIVYMLGKKHFSLIGISLLGALTHNVTQLAVAALMLSGIGFFYLLPYLTFYAIPTGLFVGLVTTQMLKLYH